MFLAMEPFHSMLDVIPIHKNATIPMSIAPTVWMSLTGTTGVMTLAEKLKLNMPIMMTSNDPGGKNASFIPFLWGIQQLRGPNFDQF